MRRILLAALLVTACAGGESPARAPDGASTASGSAGVTAVGSEGAAAPGPTGREIYIDSVKPGNPVEVFGRARTFENTVQVRVRDAHGALVTEVFTTSAGEMGNHNPFSASAWLTRSPGERLIVESFEYSAKDGSVRSLVGDTLPFQVEDRTFTLDFPTAECTTTVAVSRRAPRTLAVARLLVEALVAGPTAADSAAGATHPFPAGSRVREVTLRAGDLTVDFNERLQNVGGSCRAQAIRTSVTRTLSRLPGVRRVTITALGSAALALQP